MDQAFFRGRSSLWLDLKSRTRRSGRAFLRVVAATHPRPAEGGASAPGAQWQCAKLVSARTFGYGSYRFELNSVANNLDSNVTLGLFTWSDDPAFTDREMDVEFSRWGNAADPNNSQFVLQPFDAAIHLVRYQTPAGISNSTHLFIWEADRIRSSVYFPAVRPPISQSTPDWKSPAAREGGF